MKKTILFTLLMALFILASGCPATPNSTPSSDSSPSESVEPLETIPQESITVNSDNPLLLAEFLTDTVYSGSGKNIGTYAYVEIEKAALPDFSTEEFTDYLTEFADTKVQDSGYNWVSIIFDDGTGFCFTGSNTIIVDYGNVDDEGCITASLDMYIRSSSGKLELDKPDPDNNLTRSIATPTILQEALVPDNKFNPIEEIIFNTPASENGLGDTAFYAEGKIVSRFEMSGYDTIQFSTDLGDIYISAALVPMVISEGEANTVYFVYTGLSDEYNCPCGVYVHHESGESPNPDPSVEPSEAVQEEPIQTVTTGQRNALSRAKQYLSIMAFSHSGLIKQLEFDGYTTEEATYGADNCGADWNEQAAKKAQQYIDLMSFSRQRLIDQLKFDGFTQSQAEYGASAVGY